jgi:hypothetical protein
MEIKAEKRSYSSNNNNTGFSTNKYQKKNDGEKVLTGEELRQEQEYVAKKEDEFSLNQSKVRASKRIGEKRGKPLDFLYSVTRFPQEIPDSTTFLRPSIVINTLSKSEVDELIPEVIQFRKIDVENRDYWISIYILLETHLKTITNKIDTAGIHPIILSDIKQLLDGKSTEELIKLELFIKQSISGGEIRNDEYWHTIVNKINVYKAQAKVDEYFSLSVKERLNYLLKSGLPQVSVNEIERRFMSTEIPKKKEEEASITSEKAPVELKNRRIGRYLSDLEMLKMEEDKGENEDEARFTREVDVDENAIGKKPLYYNRERVGIDWTKHNQIMYDQDNPPPSTTLGYEFNIFFPDLLDKNKAPHYELLTTENPDLLIIVFKAGPPYKNLAFKIVGTEWEYSQKKGFRCVFSNGIFHLHCWFKRYRYRR